jgi:hypothetical protein
VGKPGPTLPLVHAETREARLHTLRECRRAAARIGEDEHADGAGLSVTERLQVEGLGRRGLPAKRVDDGVERSPRLSAEECERDVKALHMSPGGEMSRAPAAEGGGHVVRNLEREEEPDPVIASDGSR